MDQMKSIFKRIFKIKVWGYGLFWSWNFIFLAFMLFGFAPNILPDMVISVRSGFIPISFITLGILVTLIPVGAVALGFTLLRRDPGRLLALGYGVEGPLMAILLLRIFVLRQATPGVTFLFIVSILGVLVLLWQIIDRKIDSRRGFLNVFRLLGLTCLFLVGIYGAVIVAFYAFPIGVKIPELLYQLADGIRFMLANMTWRDLVFVPFTLLGSLLFFYTATLFIAAPIAVPVLYVRQWHKGANAVVARLGRYPSYAIMVIASLAAITVFYLANQQPQHKAYMLLKEPPQTFEDAQLLLEKQQEIRTGLLNAYLAPVRYLSAVGEVGHIQSLYQWSLGISDQAAQSVEKTFGMVARPVLYEPMEPTEINGNQNDWWMQRALRSEPQKAAQLYEAFFDKPITKAERETIVNAVRNSWSGEQALTAWQGVDDREILLVEQEVKVSEFGDWAEVELFESYQNQTAVRQEVVYYFNLPESAVITGLWLGESPDREQRASFHIAPRGAAQQVYREQVRLNVDPALVEQIGPRQYRLRVYPIEPQVWRWNESLRTSTMTPGPLLYMWMTYRVLAEESRWPMPQLSEKANVYWDRSSRQVIQGVAFAHRDANWLPAAIEAGEPVTRALHQVSFPDGQVVIVQPWTQSNAKNSLVDLRSLRVGVVLDRSYSMTDVRSEVIEALRTIGADQSNVDVYLTAAEYRGEQASVAKLAQLVPEEVVFFGGQNAADLLAQFFSLSEGRKYDVLFVLTDGSGFQLGGEDTSFPVPDVPVWMVHLGGEFPLGYDDATLQAIQASGGGVAGSLDEALLRLSVYLEGVSAPKGALRDIIDGYEWVTITTGDVPVFGQTPVIHSLEDPFAALAARRLILNEMQKARGKITELETLDHLHAIAKAQGIVTPYSSMIVLVSQAQEKRLEKLESQENRFDREAEEVGETAPSPFEVTGVPEPHEWLLIGIGAIFLGWLVLKRKLASSSISI
jgi:putative PEP-CTERM system integral membrane protein